MTKQMSQPCQPGNVWASLDFLLCSSQSTGLPPEQINVNSQILDKSKIHGMMLKYSDDEVTDEKIKELNLQTAAQQYMMQQDAQNKITPLHF